jgi:hypothetical protein
VIGDSSLGQMAMSRRRPLAVILALVLMFSLSAWADDLERLRYYMPLKPPVAFKDVRYIALLNGPEYGFPGYGWIDRH